jgi:hypothetical protein
MLRRRSTPIPLLRRAAAALALAAALAGCTVTFVEREGTGSRPPADVNEVIQVFEPRGGEGSAYAIGSEISFRIRSRVEGYVTLTSLGPDGDVDVFARNLRVPSRRDVVLDGSQQGVVFVVEPPRGWHRVRASFTPRRTDASRVTFRGRAGEDDWYAAIQIDLAPFEVRDVAETRFYVR